MTQPFWDYEGRVVSLLGRIDSANIDILGDQLLRLDTASTKGITLYLSSIGGNLIDGFKILDILATLQSRVTAIAMGLVQGCGVLVFAAAPERFILPNSLLFTEGLWSATGLETNPASGFGSRQIHPRDALMTELAAQVDRLSTQSPSLSRLIHEASVSPRLITAGQAVALGLADEIVEGTTKHLPQIRTKAHDRYLSH